MKLKATQLEYRFEDDSGYRFDVVCTKDEWGWSASVTMSAHGMRTTTGAIRALAQSVRAFLRQLDTEQAADVSTPDPEQP